MRAKYVQNDSKVPKRHDCVPIKVPNLRRLYNNILTLLKRQADAGLTPVAAHLDTLLFDELGFDLRLVLRPLAI